MRTSTNWRLTNIGSLAVVPAGPVRGSRMHAIAAIPDAELHVREGRIAWFGPRAAAPRFQADHTCSADGGCVVPGLIDCHTHIPFVGSRSGEFTRRLGGESYLSILQSGGGIRVTTAAVRAASEDQLVERNLPRLDRMLRNGVTTCECKSGYGLSPEAELKQLQAIRRLAGAQPVELVATYLGAHAVPAEYHDKPDEFLAVVGSEPLLRQIAEEHLAEFCDVFCDRGAFDVQQSRRLLLTARKAGLKLKLHADELLQIGASRLAGELGAVSADHLETIDEAGIDALRTAGTVPVALPGTSFFLGIDHCDARKLMKADLPLAIGSDFNPGSCMIESLPLVMNIACCQLRLQPMEVLVACTANAAAAIDRHSRLGAIAEGFDADLLVLDAPSVEEWLYEPGRSRTKMVFKGGDRVV